MIFSSSACIEQSILFQVLTGVLAVGLHILTSTRCLEYHFCGFIQAP